MSVETTGTSAAPQAMPAVVQDFLLLLGRVLAGWIFVQSGWRKLMDIPAFVATMPRRGLPDFLGYVAPPVEVIGGVCLMLGLFTRYAALLLVLFTVIATLSSHRFWSVEPAQYTNQHSHFFKNTSMTGGLIVLLVAGAGRWALDWLLWRKR